METQMRGLALSIALSLALLTGCNTIQGMGKDIARGGEKTAGLGGEHEAQYVAS